MSGAKKKAEATQPVVTDPEAPASGSVAPTSTDDASKDDSSKDAPNEDPASKPSKPPKAPKKPKAYFVAKGRSVGTKSRGIVPENDQVFANDFSAAEERITQLIAAGYVVSK